MRNRPRLTHCKNGHEFTPSNTYVSPSGKYRTCRICTRERSKRWEFANPEKVKQNYRNQLAKGSHAKSRRKWESKNPSYYRNKQLKNSYKLTVEDFDRMLEDQKGLCGICKEPMAKAYVDHCHESGIVRELLCFSCNISLGHFKDNIETLKSAIAYLEKHNAKYRKFSSF